MSDDASFLDSIDFTRLFGMTSYTAASSEFYLTMARIDTFHEHEIRYATAYHQEQSDAAELVIDPTIPPNFARSLELDEYLTNVDGLAEWEHFYMINSSCIQMAVTALEVYVHSLWREHGQELGWDPLGPRTHLSTAVDSLRPKLAIPNADRISIILTARNKLTHQDGYIPADLDDRGLSSYCTLDSNGRIQADEDLVRRVVKDVQAFVDSAENALEAVMAAQGRRP